MSRNGNDQADMPDPYVVSIAGRRRWLRWNGWRSWSPESWVLPLHVRRLHAQQAQHQEDLSSVVDLMLLDTMDKNLSS